VTKCPVKKIIYRLTSVLHNNKNIDRTTCILMWHTSDLVNWHSTKTTVDWVELASCPAVRPYSGLASTSYWLLCHTTERNSKSIRDPSCRWPPPPVVECLHATSSTYMEEHANANNIWTASPVAEGLHATMGDSVYWILAWYNIS